MAVTQENPPAGIDVTRPSVARVYDYWLGGKDNFASKYDTSTTVLACYSAVGFDQDLRGQAARTSKHILLIGPDDLYAA